MIDTAKTHASAAASAAAAAGDALVASESLHLLGSIAEVW
jgi:hypothetical protein